MKGVSEELLERFFKEVEQSFAAGEYTEARRMLRRFMRHKTQGKPHLRMKVLLGKSYIDEGNWKKALEVFETAGKSAGRHEDHEALASILNYSGDCHSIKGDIDAAVGFYKRSLRICKEKNISGETLARNISDLAQAAERVGQYSKALPRWEEAVGIYRTLPGSREHAYALLNTAMLKSRQGRIGEAISETEESIAVLESLGQTVDISDSLWMLGMLYMQKGDYRTGFRHMEKAIRETSSAEGISLLRAYTAYVKALMEVGNLVGARFHGEKALAISRRLNWTYGIAAFQALIGQVRLAENDVVAAIRYAQEAGKGFEDIGHPLGIARAQLSLAEAQTCALNLAEAGKALERAVSVSNRIEDVVIGSDCVFAEAMLLVAQKKSAPLVTDKLRELCELLRGKWSYQYLRSAYHLSKMLMLEGNLQAAADSVRDLLVHTRQAIEGLPEEFHDSFSNSPLCRAITKLVLELHVEKTLQDISIDKVIEAINRPEKEKLPELSASLEIPPDETGRPELVFKSGCMKEIKATADRIAAAWIPVLITGETGVGKEVLARHIHYHSGRRGPFVPLNCAAIPSSLMESELFGYAKGAFTGANYDKEGLLVTADKGTLFLDEIGDMPSDMQAKLLRVLEENKVRPLGATELIKTDIRLICATNRDLRKEVEKGGFREDLFYRINVVTLDMPPLRTRREDIPLLVHHFMEQSGKQATIEQEAMDAMLEYDWPGNVREIKNEIARLLAVSRKTIKKPMVKEEIRNPQTSKTSGGLQEMEKKMIQEVLRQTSYNKKKAARVLGISRTTLYEKIKRYQIEHTDS